MIPSTVSFWGFVAITVILLGIAAVVLYKMINDSIKLEGLIAEPFDPEHPDRESKASLSRFQFLIFTFVIAGLYLLLSIEAGTFIEIPSNVLGLLGISGGSFVLSKAVSSQGEKKKTEPNGGKGGGAGGSTP